MNDEAEEKTGNIGHTALVFFHGIGNPRKLGTLTTFLDEFDRVGSSQDPQKLGVPRNFRHKIEEGEDGSSSAVVQFRRIKKFKKIDVQVKIVRAYEGYWGDDLTRPISMLTFILWILKIVVNSFRILRSPWRRYPLYRIRSLHLVDDMFSGRLTREKLEAIYRKFGSAKKVDRWKAGTRQDFIAYLESDEVKGTYGDFSAIAKSWFEREKNVLRSFLFTATSVLVFAFFMLLVVGFLIWSTLGVAAEAYSVPVALHIPAAVSIYALFLWLAWSPVKQRISDVYFWTSYDERSNGFSIRERRIDQAERLIQKVIKNDRCNDCVIVAHSLGSAIATEAFFRISDKIDALDISDEERECRRRQFQKIRFMFVAGSPIDNIFSLFQESYVPSRRYSRIQEQKSASFKRDHFYPSFAMVNIWSRFDPISARILSLRTPENRRNKMVFNSESVPSGIPAPLAAHSGYFQDEAIMTEIYRAVMTGRFNPQNMRAEYLEVELGRWKYISFLGLPLCIIMVIGASLFEIRLLSAGSLVALGGLLYFTLKKYASDVKEQAECRS
ncbi:pimeloyl-ACP methyl ester carboxylesterase [Sagittula marina]|uniref:Pimeloyl-ACP methyl ester carboxylesterase n=1 Tax=Sagittula marina TaxID=943940 RepID=A0A7W6DTH3_9RHOB|nr:hypothetical protein [Sagittula marina]MBB3984944.1 pimeloyl-ACP methyl ester carboxylesterase [Sagittula marina]